MLVFETMGITEVIEASEVVMVYVVFEATESLKNHFDTFFNYFSGEF